MKKLTLFVAALCATTMAVNAAETEWQKVTAEPTDWSGNYILVYEKTTKGASDSAYVWTGVDAPFCYTPAVIAEEKVTGSDFVSITIASTEKGKCSILVNGGTQNGKYFGYTAGKNGMSFNDAAIENSISYDATNKCVLIKSGTKPSTLSYNASAGTDNSRFRYYGTAQKSVQLYKKVAGAAINATAIALDKNAVELAQYKYITLTATPTPADATDEWEWKSDNEEVATVNATGKVNVIAATGTATITITSKTTATVTASCVVTAKAADVLTCAQAVEIASKLSKDNEIAADGKYVIRGYVTEVPYEYDETNKNMTVWLADVAGADNAFEAYKAVPVAAADQKIKVGDLVEVVGDITKYGTTYETAAGATIRLITAGPATALENVEALEVYAENGRIYAAEGARIFTVSGIDVTEMNGQLNGIYIVKVGNQATKIAVK